MMMPLAGDSGQHPFPRTPDAMKNRFRSVLSDSQLQFGTTDNPFGLAILSGDPDAGVILVGVTVNT
jgi:hypothetical protein